MFVLGVSKRVHFISVYIIDTNATTYRELAGVGSLAPDIQQAAVGLSPPYSVQVAQTCFLLRSSVAEFRSLSHR